MSTVTVTLADGSEEVFEETTLGHQIGNGAVQIILKTGGHEIYNNFQKVIVVPSDEEQADFEKQQAAVEAQAEAMEAERQAADKAQMSANDKDGGSAEDEKELAN